MTQLDHAVHSTSVVCVISFYVLFILLPSVFLSGHLAVPLLCECVREGGRPNKVCEKVVNGLLFFLSISPG